MFKDKTFEESICGYSLRFHQPILEEIFVQSRLYFLRLPAMTKRLLWGMVIFVIGMSLGDTLRLCLQEKPSSYIMESVKGLALMIGSISLELLACKWLKLAFLRGIPSHLGFSFLILYSSFMDYSDKVQFPVIDIWYLLLLK